MRRLTGRGQGCGLMFGGRGCDLIFDGVPAAGGLLS